MGGDDAPKELVERVHDDEVPSSRDEGERNAVERCIAKHPET